MPFVRYVEKYSRAGQATVDTNTAHSHCMLDTQGYEHTLTICNTYCFSTFTVVTGTHLNVTFYVYCLSCLFVGWGWDDVILQMQPLILTTVHPTDDRWVNVEQRWYDRLQEKSEFLLENPFPSLIYPPQNLHGTPPERTWVTAVRSLGCGRPT